MGQLQHLERVALGRSAFEDLEPDQVPPETEDEGRQQYDPKGRPKDLYTERMNADQRRAQNEILALVGVVEHIDELHRQREREYQKITEARKLLFENENDMGMALELIAIPCYLMHRWVRAFIARVQIGFYDCKRPLASVLAVDWHTMSSGGWLQKFAMYVPGLGEVIVIWLVVMPLTSAIAFVVGETQSYIIRQSASHKTARRLAKAVEVVLIGTELAIAVAMMPIKFYSTAQRLGLAPQLPLFPPWHAMLPWQPDLLFRRGWGLRGSSMTCTTFQPAALMIANDFLGLSDSEWFGFSNQNRALGSGSTSHMNPNVDNTLDSSARPSPIKSPIACIFHTGCQLRNLVLRWMGWRTSKDESSGQICHLFTGTGSSLFVRQIDSRYSDSQHRSYHRDTALAQLLPRFLAMKIEYWLVRLLTLPLESWLLRSIAIAYMKSTSCAKTSTGSLAAENLYQPFGGGPFGRMISSRGSSSTWANLRNYSCHLALALALDCTIDVLYFVAKYGLVRISGIAWFGYQRKDVEHDERVRALDQPGREDIA